MKLVRLSLVAFITAASAWPAVYYVDRTGGSDTQNGTSPDSAWSSLGHVNHTLFAPGDYVLLKRGQTWTEPLIIASSGTDGVPVTYGAYGSGARPVIDGSGFQSSRQLDVVSINNATNVVLSSLDLRNSQRNGINAYNVTQLVIRDVSVSANRQHGMLIFNCNQVLIEDAEVFGNSLDLTADYDGIRIDGSGPAMSGFSIRHSKIHDNLGGQDWNSSNGIFIGHTGSTAPMIKAVSISGNQIYNNGNPSQNQAGRGINGTFQGDIVIEQNYIYRNASAGIYIGDYGLNSQMSIQNNVFYNNALRQFGGTSDTSAIATHNATFVDDPSITAMGAEVGGAGGWVITNNAFLYLTGTTDSFRGFIRVNDSAQQQVLVSDWNLFYSAGPQRWKLSDGVAIDFSNWMSAGFDLHSKNPQ